MYPQPLVNAIEELGVGWWCPAITFAGPVHVLLASLLRPCWFRPRWLTSGLVLSVVAQVTLILCLFGSFRGFGTLQRAKTIANCFLWCSAVCWFFAVCVALTARPRAA